MSARVKPPTTAVDLRPYGLGFHVRSVGSKPPAIALRPSARDDTRLQTSSEKTAQSRKERLRRLAQFYRVERKLIQWKDDLAKIPVNSPRPRRGRSTSKSGWDLEPGTWNLEPGTWNRSLAIEPAPHSSANHGWTKLSCLGAWGASRSIGGTETARAPEERGDDDG